MRYVVLFLVFPALLIAQQKRTLGAQPSDQMVVSKFKLALESAGVIKSIPYSISMVNECPPVKDQCSIGACVSYAAAYGLCKILAKRENYGAGLFSPMHVHNSIKLCDNDCGKCGAQLAAAANHLMDYGVPALSEFDPDACERDACTIRPPYIRETYKLKSVQPLFLAGLQYSRGFKKTRMKSFLAQKHPIVIAMPLDSAFADGSAFNNPTGTWNNFNIDKYIGNHAMLVVGYDEGRKAFMVMNSWGSFWNTQRQPNDTLEKGYCWIGYDLMDQYCYEAFVANLPQTPYFVEASELYIASANVHYDENADNMKKYNVKNKTAKDQVLHVNQFDEYEKIKIIPLNPDKSSNTATIAIYEENAEQKLLLHDLFAIKMGENYPFKIGDRNYVFSAKAIEASPGKGAAAVLYDLTVK